MTACTGNGEKNNSSQNPQSSEATSDQKNEDVRKLYIRAPKKEYGMTATFINTSSGKTTDVEMKKSGETEFDSVFCCEADANLYNMVHVTYGTITSMDVAFNSFVSGWNLVNRDLLPYVEGTEPSYDPQFETKKFQFDGRDKNVYIWTPADYARSQQKNTL